MAETAPRDPVDVAAEPVAWVDFTAGGYVRFWTADWHRANRETKAGRAMQPLYTAEALRSASNSAAEAMRDAVIADLSAYIGRAEGQLAAARPGTTGLTLIEERVMALDAARSRVAALPLPAPAPASPWRVKKLKWRKPADHPQDPEDAALVAVGIGGRYAISKAQLTTAFGPNGHLLWDAEDNFSFTEHRTIETAKAAAQADYEARIRSAIEPDLPTPPASKGT